MGLVHGARRRIACVRTVFLCACWGIGLWPRVLWVASDLSNLPYFSRPAEIVSGRVAAKLPPSEWPRSGKMPQVSGRVAVKRPQ